MSVFLLCVDHDATPEVTTPDASVMTTPLLIEPSLVTTLSPATIPLPPAVDILAETPTLEDVLQGARAVNPDITVEELIRLANDPETMEKIKSAKEFKFIVIGKTGIGKSTLINGLIGAEVAEVDESFISYASVTQKVESYHVKINDIEVVAYDSPGLEDGSGKEEGYLEEIYQTCQQGIHLVIFAVPMTRKRFTPDNACTMEKLTKKLTSTTWENTLVILTCANTCEALTPHLQYKTKEDKQNFFKKLVKDYKAAIHQTLKTIGVPAAIVDKVKVVPVGHEFEPELLDGTLWISNFWFECLTTIPTAEGRVALTKVNEHHFKKNKEVTGEDFLQVAPRAEVNHDRNGRFKLNNVLAALRDLF